MDTKSSDEPTRRPRPTSEVFDVVVNSAAGLESVQDSASIFDEDFVNSDGNPVPGYPQLRYMPFGYDDNMPFELVRTIGGDEVLAQNIFFNILTAYGSGIAYNDRRTGQPSEKEDIERFFLENSMQEFFLEQCTDMKHYFFSVAVVILDVAGEKIVQVRHKDACYCRFEKADKKGRINHVFFAQWKKAGSLGRNDVEMIQLLDEKNPLGHLSVLMGKAPGLDGEIRKRTSLRKFAVVMRFPTPGQRYYPLPYYLSLFRGDWYDIKRLIGKGKKAKIRNHAPVRYQVEINDQYWDRIVDTENILDPEKQQERFKLEKERIRDFVTGIENSGKVWITGYYVDPYGHEQHMVKITVVDNGKEGGDWSEDVQESSNMMCYGTNIHPNLVGATPGKSQSNNSGSDKRELFTLKQSLETAFHDMLLKVHNVIIWFNGWNKDVRPAVPLVLLSTLDQHTDAKKVSDGKVTDVNE